MSQPLPIASLSPSSNEYSYLYQSAILSPDKQPQLNEAIARITKNKDVYSSAVEGTNIPWYAVGIIDEMECGCSEYYHIHNGDPLTGRTYNAPANRPEGGKPPFSKLESIQDWIHLKKWNTWQVWDINSLLFRFEANNGFGYRKYRVNTPYLWAGSNLYTSGKFIVDGQFSKAAVSKQIGAALLLKNLL
jgi:lysozyme family protein